MIAMLHNSDRLVLVRALALLCLLCCFATQPAICETSRQTIPQAAPKNILLLYSYGHGGKGIDVFDEGLLETLSTGGVGTNSLFFEYLDLERNKADPQYRMHLHDLLRRKYAERHVDVIITVQQPALNWLLNEGKGIAPAAPTITVQAPLPSLAEAGNRQIISELNSFDIKGTLERALELFPDTRRLMFVAGSSDADRRIAAEAAHISSPWQGKLEFEYTTEMTFDAILKRVASLPPQSIIVFTQYNRDISGLVTVAYEVEGKIIKVANAPVFGLYDFNLRNGGIGGSVVGVKDLGQKTGKLALDLLSGTLKLAKPVTGATIDTISMFDWNQIQRWGGNPNNLTVQPIFVNRQPTFWEQYKLYVIGAALFLIAQSLLIIALLISRRRRKLAEVDLRHSQKTTQEVINGIPSLIYALDTDGRFLFANRAFYDLFKLDPARLIGHGRECLSMPPHIVEDHRNHDLDVMRGARPIEFEERNAEGDGEHFYLTQKFPLIETDGRVYGVCGISTDITALKHGHALTESLLKTIPFPIDIVDAQGKVLYMSSKMEQVLGRQTPGEQCWVQYRDDKTQCTDCPLTRGIRIGETAAIESTGVFGGRVFEIQHTGMLYQGKEAIMEIFLDITERKKVEDALRESESSLRESQVLGRLGSWKYDLVTQKIEWSDELHALYQRDTALGPPSIEDEAGYYSPAEAARLHGLARLAAETGRDLEYDFAATLPNGETRYFHGILHPVTDRTASVIHLTGTIQDITERTRLESVLAQRQVELLALYRSIETRREEDRRKIARELHDDLGHRLTTLSMDLERMESKLLPGESPAKTRLPPIFEQIREVADAVRRICEDLRPGMLDALGLPAAIEGHVSSFAARTGIPCELVMSHEDFAVDGDVAINIFRVVQEALNNCMKYAKASKIGVTLQFSEHDISLIIEDDGIGLAAKGKGGRIGFGLLGMRERVNTLNGQLSITSEPGRGVRIEAVIPITKG